MAAGPISPFGPAPMGSGGAPGAPGGPPPGGGPPLPDFAFGGAPGGHGGHMGGGHPSHGGMLGDAHAFSPHMWAGAGVPNPHSFGQGGFDVNSLQPLASRPANMAAGQQAIAALGPGGSAGAHPPAPGGAPSGLQSILGRSTSPFGGSLPFNMPPSLGGVSL